MRRLLAIVVILAGVLSVAVGASSVWGQQPNLLDFCVVFVQGNGFQAYDFVSGKSLHLARRLPEEYLSQWKSAATRSDKRAGLILKPLMNDNIRLFLAKPDGTFQFLRDISVANLPQWTVDERKVAFLWSTNERGGEQNVSIVNVEDGTEKVLPIPSNGTQTTMAWAADGQFISLIFGAEINVYDSNFHLVFHTLSGSNYPVHLSWSTVGHRFAYSESSQTGGTVPSTITMLQADGSAKQQYQTITASNSIETPSLSWSPDGRHLLAAGQSYTFISAIAMGMTVIDTTTGATRLVSGLSTNTWINDQTLTVWRIVDSRINLVAVDLAANTETTLFESEDQTPTTFDKRAIFSARNVDGSKDLWAMNLDGSQKQLMMANIDDWTSPFIAGKSRSVVLLGWRGAETVLSVLGLENSLITPVLTIPSRLTLTENMVDFIPNSDWLAMSISQNSQPHGILLNIKTGAIKEQGVGTFKNGGTSRFQPFVQVVFVEPLENNKTKYHLFDKDGNVTQTFIVPNEFSQPYVILSPDGNRIAVQTITAIGDPRPVSIIENNSEVVKPVIVQRQIAERDSPEFISWTLDSKYLMVSQIERPSTVSPTDRKAAVGFYDLEGRRLLTRYFDPASLRVAGFTASPCAPDQLNTPGKDSASNRGLFMR